MNNDEEDYQQIFINQKGFYHIPDTVMISKIKLGAENQIAQIFYIYEYRTTYRAEKSFTPERIEKHIIGQYTDQILPLNTDIISLIQQDYYKERYNIQESDNIKRIIDVIKLEQCAGVLLDLTPYTFLKYTYADDNTNYPLLIGETGIFNGFKD